ncbi:AsmA-like C-terminal domain-containing protein [Halomonas sp. NYA30]
MPDANTRKNRLPRLLFRVLIGLLFIILIWVAGSYWLLNSQWLPKRISQFEGIDIRWEQGASRHPGRWEVEGLYLAREDEALPISIEAERATLSLSLLALLRGELHINALDAEGIRRLIVGDIALEAEGQLHVAETTLSRDTLAIPNVSLAITNGRLVRLSDQATLVHDIDLTADATLDTITPVDATSGQLNPNLLAALSAQLQLNAQADAWDVFMPYLDALPWLTLEGRGALTGTLELTAGKLQPGSELMLDAPVLRLAVDEQRLRASSDSPRWLIADNPPPRHTATGKGQVRLAIENDQLHFSTQLADVELAEIELAEVGLAEIEQDEPRPYAEHAELRLATQIPNQRLDQLDLPTAATLALKGNIIRLDMLDRYLTAYADEQGIRLSGHGQMDASASIRESRPFEAQLNIQAPELAANTLGFIAQGSGSLNARLTPQEIMEATFNFNDATLHHQERLLLDDADINLIATSPINPQKALDEVSATLSWQAARLPDIRVLQSYLAAILPTPAPLQLLSGQATSHGQLTMTPEQLSGEVHLAGSGLTTRWQHGEQAGTLTSDMQLFLPLQQVAMDGSELNISGTRLSWQVADIDRPSERLESVLVLTDGCFQRRNSMPSGQFALEGSVQRLGFLNAFLPDAHGLAIAGEGQLFAQGAFRDNRLLAPTRLRVNADQLEVTFLDYLATGRGELTAQLNSTEQAQLSLGIPRFVLKRQDDDSPHVQGRHFALTTQTKQFSEVLESPQPEHFTTRIALPITEVPDFTRYNRYLPEGAGITLLDGQASLTSEWLLEGLNAQGEITLRAFGAELALLDQRLRGDVHLYLHLTDGDLNTRRFTANDSFLRLENVNLQNENGSSDAGWWVQLSMFDAQLAWEDPVRLASQLRLEMRDTGLLARLFLARARDSDWLGRLLNVHDIEGTAQLEINGELISLQDLTLTGGPLLLLSDIALADRSANGALYAHLGVVGLGVELEDSEPTLHVIQPRRWFNRWRKANGR